MFHTSPAPRDGTDAFRELVKYWEVTGLDSSNKPGVSTRYNEVCHQDVVYLGS